MEVRALGSRRDARSPGCVQSGCQPVNPIREGGELPTRPTKATDKGDSMARKTPFRAAKTEDEATWTIHLPIGPHERLGEGVGVRTDRQAEAARRARERRRGRRALIVGASEGTGLQSGELSPGVIACGEFLDDAL